MRDPELREELQERLATATTRLRSIEAEVTRLKRHIQGLKDVLATIREAPPVPSLFELGAQDKPTLADLSIKNAARTVLLDVKNTPMTAKEIFEAIQSRGKIIGGKVPLETLRATLSTSAIFEKTPDRKWMLVDQTADPDLEEYEPPQPE